MRKYLSNLNVIFFLLTTSILLTIVLAWILYPLEIQWLGITEATGFSAAIVSKNFHILMNYLTNPFQWTLAMPDFPSSANGLHHFEAVKFLFHLVEVVFIVTLPGFVSFVRKIVKGGYVSLYRSTFFWMAILPVIIALMTLLIGFDQFFVFFHQVLFVGDATWLFDPRVDSIILALPETYFMHAFLLFFIIYEGICIGFYLLSRRKK